MEWGFVDTGPCNFLARLTCLVNWRLKVTGFETAPKNAHPAELGRDNVWCQIGQPVVLTFEHQHITLASQNSSLCSLQYTQRLWGTHCLSDYASAHASGASEKQVSFSHCLWAAGGGGVRSLARKLSRRKRKRLDRMDMEAPHARGGGRGGVVVALTCGETRSVPRRPPPASHRPSLSLLCAFLQRVNNYPCDKHGSCAPDDEKHARRSLSVDSCGCLSLTHSLTPLFRARWDEKIGLECLIPC